jgi:hypothetical protein
VPDWATIASLATAAGTLVLAVATFASVRSGSRTARVAERALLAGLRPLLAPSRLTDAPQKVMFVDGRWLHPGGGRGAVEMGDDALYMAIPLRNVGSGIAVLHGWYTHPEQLLGLAPHPPLGDFRRLTRDLYVPAGDVGFWQGALRDPQEEPFAAMRARIAERQPFTVDILYGDHEGGQRTITRFSMVAFGDDEWLASVGRHWSLDRPQPRG